MIVSQLSSSWPSSSLSSWATWQILLHKLCLFFHVSLLCCISDSFVFYPLKKLNCFLHQIYVGCLTIHVANDVGSRNSSVETQQHWIATALQIQHDLLWDNETPPKDGRMMEHLVLPLQMTSFLGWMAWALLYPCNLPVWRCQTTLSNFWRWQPPPQPWEMPPKH